MRILVSIFIIVLSLHSGKFYAQESDQTSFNFTSLSEALKNPERVRSLDLSNQEIDFPPNVFARFVNLEYLSLKNGRSRL